MRELTFTATGLRSLERAAAPVLLGLAILCVSTVRAGDWPGWRGLESQGASTNLNVPTHWSVNHGLAWKTRIAGLGHSSPIVCGDSVYLTTAYPTVRHHRLRWVVRVAGLVLVGAALVSALGRTGRQWAGGRWDKGLFSSEAAVALFQVVLLSGLAMAALLGHRLLRLEQNDGRFWKMSVLVWVTALLAGVLFCPARSRKWLLGGLAGLLSILPLAAFFPDLREFLRFGSLSALINHGLLTVPAVVGIGLIAVHLWRRRFHSAVGSVAAPSSAPQSLAFVACLLGGVFYFVDANPFQRQKEVARAVVSVSLADGRIRWICEGLIGPGAFKSRMNSLATPTPVSDGHHVVAWFGSAGLMCVDTAGQLLWSRRDLPSEGRFGAASSPVLRGDRVLLVSDVEASALGQLQPASYVAALEVKTGRGLWRRERSSHDAFASYVTPVILPQAGREVLWVRGWEDLTGYDLETGETVASWALAHAGEHLAASPTADGSRLFVASAEDCRGLDLSDPARDRPPLLWSVPMNGEVCATPVAKDGLLYLVSEYGDATCLETASGHLVWKEQLEGAFFSSVIAAGAQIYFTNNDGVTTVVSTDRTLRKVAQNDLGESVFASLVPLDGRLLIRGVEHLYCVGAPQPGR